jgi:hypothetical protein
MGPQKNYGIFQQGHFRADQNPAVRKPKKKNGKNISENGLLPGNTGQKTKF